ncbi:MAG: surface lipoprotein assembly modifier [Pseudomonadota bacterium]
MRALQRRLYAAALITGFGLSAAGVLAEETNANVVDIPLDEARIAAVNAGITGNVPLARAIAVELLKIDPDDADAHLAMSTVHLSEQDWEAAFVASKRAFRFSDVSVNRYHAARVAAAAAIANKRVIPAQYWLRRAGDLAPGPVQRRAVERNFRLLRAETPWSYKFRFSAVPSDNVNGGSSNAVLEIGEENPEYWVINPASQALSGLTTTAGLNLAYRINQNADGRTSLTSGISVKRVFLSDEAKEQAPDFDADRLGTTSLSFGISHARILGEDRKAVLRLNGGIRDVWSDGERSYTAPTASVIYADKLSDDVQLVLQLSAENRFYTDSSDALHASTAGVLSYTFPSGASVSGLLSYNLEDARLPQWDSSTWAAKITYTFGKPVIEGVDLSIGAGVTLSDYPDFNVLGFNGREDEGVFAELEATLTKIEYAGFSPHLRLRRAITESNIDLYDTQEWSFSVGIESNF